LVRQRQWLIDLDRLLDPAEPPSSATAVAAKVDRYLLDLRATTDPSGNEFDIEVATHIDRTFRNRWRGLFTCYQVEGLPRTNNELETFLRRLKTGQRRVTGRKNVHDFIVRYGRFVAYIDHNESQDSLLARLRQVEYEDFVHERKQLVTIQERAAKYHRFRHRRVVFLQQLETRWVAAHITARLNLC
jgi:hypothetical protein